MLENGSIYIFKWDLLTARRLYKITSYPFKGFGDQRLYFPCYALVLFDPALVSQMCKVCSMLLPNKCSFRAHQRIHAHKSPYCCPECGAQSRSADIQKHVRENCLHYARKAWYK